MLGLRSSGFAFRVIEEFKATYSILLDLFSVGLRGGHSTNRYRKM